LVQTKLFHCPLCICRSQRSTNAHE